jgi:type IV secretory pathway VirB2 component (pilin)
MKNANLKIFFFLLLLTVATPLFAIMPAGMTTLAENILEIFTSRFVRIILICCLIGCGVAYAFNKDNEKMKRNILAVGVGLIIVVAASGIVDALWTAAG